MAISTELKLQYANLQRDPVTWLRQNWIMAGGIALSVWYLFLRKK